MASFDTLMRTQDVVLLDGATGTELERQGFATSLPLWTADACVRAPDLLYRIHTDYLAAGVDIVTANTFRTAPYTLRKLGREPEAAALVTESVAIARRACRVAGHGLVAGSLAPLEDCYRPDRVPAAEIVRREHALHAHLLADAGVDLLLVETMGTAREAHGAAEAALDTGLPVLVSFILDPAGSGDLLSGEDFEAALAHLRALEVDGRRLSALLVNCTRCDLVLEALDRMESAPDSRPIGAYPNLGAPGEPEGWKPDASSGPATLATWAQEARARGARILGGCCGTTAEHLRAMATALGRVPT